MEKTVTISRNELIEKCAEATVKVMDNLMSENNKHIALTSLEVMIHGGLIASSLAEILFGEEK